MKIKLEAKGIEETVANIRKLSPELKREISQQVAKSALNIQKGAKERCPVDTGALRNSITVDFYGQMSAEIAPHMPYAPYVEFGTRKMKAQPYLFPAFEEERPKFEAGLKKAIEEATK